MTYHHPYYSDDLPSRQSLASPRASGAIPVSIIPCEQALAAPFASFGSVLGRLDYSAHVSGSLADEFDDEDTGTMVWVDDCGATRHRHKTAGRA